ncbi:MAG: phage portal protein [Bacteroidales bacterium]|nr:phage portal protein [Bacteroidales bacterium]
MNREDIIKDFIAHPEKLLQKKPFTRGADNEGDYNEGKTVATNGTVEAQLPRYKRRIVSQEQFMRELDPACHNCLFDINIPSICVKVADGNYYDIKYEKLAMPFQRIIAAKQVLHLTGNPMEFTMMDTNPTEKQKSDYQTIKKYWKKRNQDGMKRKLAMKQMTLGDAGLLYYFDYKGRVKSRILSYDEGYVLCPHNDDNGDRVCEAVYYQSDGNEYIDMYTDDKHYRFTNAVDERGDLTGWAMESGYPKLHGFSEIPLVTKRGDVAWNNVQSLIESWEILNNVFNAIQKRFGWGLLYIKGRFAEKAKKIAGNVVLNDTSLDGNGDAKFLTPPSPEGTMLTLEKLEDSIKLGSGTTFILPKDIHSSGDLPGITIQLVQSLDIETAEQNAIEYQNVADKMWRLFKEGIAKELVKNGKNNTALTDFSNVDATASFKVWVPRSKSEYNKMLLELTGGGLLSKKTGIEKNTESTADEEARLDAQNKEEQTNSRTQTEFETE